MSEPDLMRRSTRSVLAVGASLCVLVFGAPAMAAEPTMPAGTPLSAREPQARAPYVRSVAPAVAVANDGTMAAAGSPDVNSVELISADGGSRVVGIDCRPVDVAIAPDATTAWAVCQGDPHVYAIDIATSAVVLASIDARQADDIVYLPEARRLVVADLAGEVVVVSVKGSDDYEVIARIATPDFRPTALAVLPDGRGVYAVSDAGRLIYVDLGRGTVRSMTGLGPDVMITSVALSQTGTRLYAGAIISSSDGGWGSAIVALDPASGRVLQTVPLDFTLPGFTTIAVSAGHRSLTVGTGLAIEIGGVSVGAFDIALAPDGSMGTMTSVLDEPACAADVARSADGQRGAVSTTNATVVGFAVDDPAYPPSLAIRGAMRAGKLRLTGSTGGMRPGTVVTVHVKDLVRKRQPFVTEAKTAVVTATGAFTWSGKAAAQRVRVFVTATQAAIPAITVAAG